MQTEAKKTGFIRIWNAFKYSLDGLKAAAQDEAAFRQELGLCLVLIPIAAIAPFSLFYKALLIFSMVMVLVVELLNTSIEALTDLYTKEYHSLAKKAKDCGSAAVLLSLLISGSLWGIGIYDWLCK